MADKTFADIDLGVNLIPNDKTLKKALDDLKRVRFGSHDALKETLSRQLFHMITSKEATTGLGAAILLKKQHNLKLSPQQDAVLRAAAGMAESGKRVVVRAEKEFESAKTRKLQEQERLTSEANKLNRYYAERDLVYAEAQTKRMNSFQFKKLTNTTANLNEDAVSVLERMEKAGLKDTKEFKALKKNSDKYVKIATKTQKELGIKGPSMLSKIAPIFGKIPGLGAIASLAGIMSFLQSRYKSTEQGIAKTTQEHQAYLEGELDVGKARAFAKSYGLTEEQGLNFAKYIADVQARGRRGNISTEEFTAWHFTPRFAQAIMSGKGFDEASKAMVEDMQELSKSPEQFALARQYLGATPIGTNILATRREFLTKQKKDALTASETEKARWEVTQKDKYVTKQAGSTILSNFADKWVGRLLFGGVGAAVSGVSSLVSSGSVNQSTTNINMQVNVNGGNPKEVQTAVRNGVLEAQQAEKK